MSLITCPECGKEVSDKAKACPNCGAPLEKTIIPEVEVQSKENFAERYRNMAEAEENPKNSKLSIAALVLSIIGCTFIFGAICAIIDLCKKDGRKKTVSIIALVISAIWLILMAIVANTESEKSSFQEGYNDAVNEGVMIDGFEKAEYEKYNSYASENGLDGTLIYIEGKVVSQAKIGDGNDVAVVVEQDDGDRWCVSIISDKEISDIDDEEIRVFGTYLGFSDLLNLPGLALVTDDIDKIDLVRIEKKNKDGEYEIVLKYSDLLYEQARMESENEENTETDDIETEENNYSSEAVNEKTEDQVENITIGKRNALEKAKSYLNIMPFSYSGLIDQLEYDGYTSEEATYGADNCGADWNEQAAKKAQDYLDMMSFSREGLIEQLEYDGYTHEQAVYGVNAVGYNDSTSADTEASTPYEKGRELSDELSEKLENIDWEGNYGKADEAGEKAAEFLNQFLGGN